MSVIPLTRWLPILPSLFARPPLPDFTKINDSVYFHKGGDTSPHHGQTSDSKPDLILVLGWGGAPLRNVAKYTTPYRDMFPGVPILLVLTEFSHIILHTPTSQDKALEPVIRLIRELIRSRDESHRSHLLLHLFSNGGSYKLVEIAKRYKRATGTRMPIDTLFVDSAPGLPAIGRSVTALSYALPKPWFVRLPGKALIWFGLVMLKFFNAILGREHLMMAMRRRLNDKDLIDGDAKRCYIYSPQDELVGMSDVQDHARDARGKGFSVREEVFMGSQHVAHAKHDPVRYWNVVRDQWARTLAKEETT